MVRAPIVIQSATTASDSYGGQTVTWADAYTIFPEEVKAVRGREEERLGRLMTVETWLFRIRFGPTVTTQHRVLYDSKIMNIRTVQDRDGMRRFLTIEAEVGVGT